MTMDEIRSSNKEYLTPKDVAEALGRDQYSINVQAQEDPVKLGFPVTVVGRRVLIPRKGFVFFWDYGRPLAHT